MPTERSWSEVRCLIDRQEFKRAFAVAERLVAQAPRNPYGHSVLGQLFLAVDDIKNAEIQYSMAYDLFPSDEAQETLQALRKRMATEHAPK
jgi:cytochrome c-type biogenesis protein CcmH/NrfG